MKKYISVLDIEDTSTLHISEVPANMFIHVKACNDGVAAVIGDKDRESFLGFTIGCDKDLLNVMQQIAGKDEVKELEAVMLGHLSDYIYEFLESEQQTIFDLDEISGCMSDYLNYLLCDIVEKKRKRNKHKHKKNNKK